MAHLVAAPDKFRGTASAVDVAAAAAAAARGAGWTADEIPLSDGGEGLLEAAGGVTRRTTVHGPFGDPVEARWQLLLPGPAGAGGDGEGRGGANDPHGVDVATAVIEMAQAAGRDLVPRPAGDDPVRADTFGVGELLLAAVGAGARRIVVGCGGSATTDGGWGAVEAVGGPAALGGADLVVACDVTTPFTEAARVFGPQKGATPAQVAELTARLRRVADRYRERFGVDVEPIAGSGAAGGLAGGLAALGGRLVPGFGLVAELVHLHQRLGRADLVVTGEGHLDLPSLSGKVVGGVIAAVAGRAPVLCIVGDADVDAVAAVEERSGGTVQVVRLVAEAGPERARSDTAALVKEVTAARLRAVGAGTGS